VSGYYHQKDLRHYVSTWPETAQGVAVDYANFNREFRLSEEEIAELVKRTGYNRCGGELYTAFVDEQWDANWPIAMPATPDTAGWLGLYGMGSLAGYSVTGVGDPYTHEFIPLEDGEYRPLSCSVVEGRKGGTKWFRYRGGLVGNWRIIGSIEGDKRVRCEAQMEFAGEREETLVFTPPTCVPEEPYRFNKQDAAISFGKIGEAAWSGLTFRGVEYALNNNLETLDECDRDGLYVASRDVGDRTEGFTARVSVLGVKGDAVDQAFREGDMVFLNTVFTNPTANRQLSCFGQLYAIATKTRGWSTSVRKSTHELGLVGYRTPGAAVTEYPFYMRVQSATPTYAQAA
jgi:hypothetical protein